MTLVEFKEKAEQLVEQYGLNKYAVTVISGCYGNFVGSSTSHIVQVFDSKKSKHIKSGLQKNPEAALESFKDNLENYFKQYDQTVKDIQL